MCAELATKCLTAEDARKVVQPLADALIGITLVATPKHPEAVIPPADASGNLRLF
jgi:hypothetical protein